MNEEKDIGMKTRRAVVNLLIREIRSRGVEQEKKEEVVEKGEEKGKVVRDGAKDNLKSTNVEATVFKHRTDTDRIV